MATLRIHDLRNGSLALDLRDLLRLLAPWSLEADWTVSTVKSPVPGHEWFDATGEGGEQLEMLAQSGARISGHDLAKLARRTRQVIWGEFVGSFPTKRPAAWMTIRAIDSSFYEVETDDQAVLARIGSTYKDIRFGETGFASWPLDHAH